MAVLNVPLLSKAFLSSSLDPSADEYSKNIHVFILHFTYSEWDGISSSSSLFFGGGETCSSFHKQEEMDYSLHFLKGSSSTFNFSLVSPLVPHFLVA